MLQEPLNYPAIGVDPSRESDNSISHLFYIIPSTYLGKAFMIASAFRNYTVAFNQCNQSSDLRSP